MQLLSWVNQIVELMHTSHTAERIMYSLRARTFAHLQRLSLDYYDKEMGGRIMTRMTTDVEALAQLLQQGLLLALTSFVSCVGVVGILLVLDVRLALAAFIVLPVQVVVTIWFQRGSRRSYLRSRDAISTVNAELQESLSGVRVTQSLGRDDNNAPRFAARSERVPRRSPEVDAADVDLLRQQPTAQHDRQGDHALVRRPPHRPRHADRPACSSRSCCTSTSSSPRCSSSRRCSISGSRPASRSGRLDELLATPTSTPEVDASDRSRPPDAEWCSCRMCTSPTRADAPEALARRRPRDPPGRVGRARRHHRRRQVDVRQAGRPVLRPDRRAGARRRHATCATSGFTPSGSNIGYVPQEPFLFSGTIRSNIAYGRPDATDVEVERAARAVGAHDLVASLPDGYLTPVAETGRSLSAGQRQLLCLARAQLVDPSILILDEATSNLDLATEAEVQRAMNLASKGRTTLLIAHRLQTARNSSRIVVVDDGQIIEDGTHDELVAARRHVRVDVGRLRRSHFERPRATDSLQRGPSGLAGRPGSRAAT